MPASALRRATRAPEKTELTTAPERERVEWDDAVKGLGLRDRGGAERRWIVQTKIGGVKLKRTLRPERSRSREEARAMARVLLAELRGEAPPAVAAPPAFDPATTVAEFAPRFLADCAGLWKPSTADQHGESLRLYVLPVLGDLRLAELTRPDVVSWRAALPVAAGTANRALAVLSGLCRHAELIGTRPPGSNPCAGLRRRKSTFKARYLTEAEYRRLGDGLRSLAATRPETAALIRFLALTGCRRDEARLLRWDWIEGGRAALPDSKAGPRAIWLAGPARALLAARPRTCGFVFARDE